MWTVVLLLTGSTDCHGCEKPNTYYVSKPETEYTGIPLYVQKPETEYTGIPIYVQKPETEHTGIPLYVQKPDTEHTGIPIYVDRPHKETMVVTQTTGCHSSNTCGSKIPDTEHTGIPLYVGRPPQKQTVVVSQTTSKCHSSGSCSSGHYVTGDVVTVTILMPQLYIHNKTYTFVFTYGIAKKKTLSMHV